MLGIEINDFDNKDFPIVGNIKTFDVNESNMLESRLFPGATISTCLKSNTGFRAHLKYEKGSKQSLIYRTCDLELVMLSGSIKITNKFGSTVLKPGSYTQIPCKTPYALHVLESSVVFVIGANGNVGMEKVDLDVEIE